MVMLGVMTNLGGGGERSSTNDNDDNDIDIIDASGDLQEPLLPMEMEFWQLSE